MSITNAVREDIEIFICQFLDAMDTTGTNTEYIKEKFAHMNNTQFVEWLSKKYPIQLQTRAFEIEPTYKNYQKAAKVVGINLYEQVALPYLYTNKDGEPVISKPALIMYIHLKKVQQMITKKNKVALNIDDRNMKTGRLNDSTDKGAQTSDREFESLAIFGLEKTMDELSTIRADAMVAKSEAYNQISTTGMLSQNDYVVNKDDSLSRNIINTYLLCSHVNSNLVNEDYMTPYTLKDKQRQVSRA